MTLDQCHTIARHLDATYLEPICPDVKRHDGGRSLSHLRWMIQEICAARMPDDKAMRFLGYVQGILVGVYGISLKGQMDLNRRLSA